MRGGSRATPITRFRGSLLRGIEGRWRRPEGPGRRADRRPLRLPRLRDGLPGRRPWSRSFSWEVSCSSGSRSIGIRVCRRTVHARRIRPRRNRSQGCRVEWPISERVAAPVWWRRGTHRSRPPSRSGPPERPPVRHREPTCPIPPGEQGLSERLPWIRNGRSDREPGSRRCSLPRGNPRGWPATFGGTARRASVFVVVG